jgi:hypothetical protein
MLALAALLQGSTCKTRFCSGDCKHDEDEEHGERTELRVLPPLRDPLGRPLTSPIWLEPRPR